MWQTPQGGCWHLFQQFQEETGSTAVDGGSSPLSAPASHPLYLPSLLEEQMGDPERELQALAEQEWVSWSPENSCCSVWFPHLIQIEGWNCNLSPSVHLQTGWTSTKMCLQRQISGSALGQRRNCKIHMVRPLYNRKEWEQVPKNAHRHLMKLFNDFKKYLR